MKKTIFEELFLEATPLPYTGSINRKGAADNDTYVFHADNQMLRLKLASMYKGLAHRYTKNHQPTIYWLELVDPNTDKALKTIPVIHKAANVVATMAEIIAESLKDNPRNPFAVLRIPATGIKADVVARIVTRYVKLYAQKFEVAGVLDISGVNHKYIVIKRKNVGDIDLNPVFGVDGGITLTSILLNQESDAAKDVANTINKNVRRMQNTDPKTDIQDSIDDVDTKSTSISVPKARSLPLTKSRLDDMLMKSGMNRVIENIERMMIQDVPDLTWVFNTRNDLYRAVEQKCTVADAVEIIGGVGTDLEALLTTKAETASMTIASYAVHVHDVDWMKMTDWENEISNGTNIGNTKDNLESADLRDTIINMVESEIYSVWEILVAMGKKVLVTNTNTRADIMTFIDQFYNELVTKNDEYRSRIVTWKTYDHISGADRYVREMFEPFAEKYGIAGMGTPGRDLPVLHSENITADITGFKFDLSDPEQDEAFVEIKQYIYESTRVVRLISLGVSNFDLNTFNDAAYANNSFISNNLDWLAGLYKKYGLFGSAPLSDQYKISNAVDFISTFTRNIQSKSSIFGFDEFDLFKEIYRHDNVRANANPEYIVRFLGNVPVEKQKLIGEYFPKFVRDKIITYFNSSTAVLYPMCTESKVWDSVIGEYVEWAKTTYPTFIRKAGGRGMNFDTFARTDLIHSYNYYPGDIAYALSTLFKILSDKKLSKIDYDLSFLNDFWYEIYNHPDKEYFDTICSGTFGHHARFPSMSINIPAKYDGFLKLCFIKYFEQNEFVSSTAISNIIQKVSKDQQGKIHETIMNRIVNADRNVSNGYRDMVEGLIDGYSHGKSDDEAEEIVKSVTNDVIKTLNDHGQSSSHVMYNKMFDMFLGFPNKKMRAAGFIEMYKRLGDSFDPSVVRVGYEPLLVNLSKIPMEGQNAIDMMQLEIKHGFKFFNKQNMLVTTKPRDKASVVEYVMNMIIDVIDDYPDVANQFYENMDSYFQKKIKSQMTGMRMVKNMVIGTEIKVVEKIDGKRLKQIFAFNDLDADEIAKSLVVRGKKGEKLTDYLSRVNDEIGKNDMVKDLHIEDAKVTVDEVIDINTKWVTNHRIGNHGNVFPAIKRVWNVHMNDDQFQEFKKKLIAENNLKQITPAFHGTSGIAANMILRYGFTVPPIHDKNGNLNPGMAGRMLGNGVYFATHIDKALLYACPSYNAMRSEVEFGYVFELETLLGNPANGRHGGDYASAGGKDSTSGASVRTPEWCVRDPKKQVRIFRCYEVGVVPHEKYKKHIEKLRSNSGKLNESRRFKFMDMLNERVVDAAPSMEMSTWQFYDGKIPYIKDGKIIYLTHDQITFTDSGYVEGDDEFVELTFPSNETYMVRFTRGCTVDYEDIVKLTGLINKYTTVTIKEEQPQDE